MQYKARLIGKRYIKKGYVVELFYEYRGKEYMLTVYNKGTFDIDEIFNVLEWED